MGERRSLPRAQNVMGELRGVKRPACSERQTGACRSCGLAVSQPCRRREEPVETTDAFRPTGGGRGAESGPSLMPNGRSDQPQPPDGCPVTEAINSNSPTTGRVSSGRRAYHSNRRTWTEDEGPASTPSYQPALVAKDQRQLRIASIPSWETGGERIILRSCPCNRDHAPRFLWSETLEKA